MIKLTETQKKFIYDNLKNPEKLMESEDVNDILGALDSLMLYEGFDSNDETNARGYEIEKIRDEIYMSN